MVLHAFDYRFIGTEPVHGRSAYVLQAAPRPGYRGGSKYGRMIAKVEGKTSVDQQDLGWVKVDGQVIQTLFHGIISGASAARIAHHDGADPRS